MVKNYREKYEKCRLCARECGVDRTQGEVGYCGCTATPKIARAALHMWEEPIISGNGGSGTIFFSGCSLGCIFCQNREISFDGKGKEVRYERIAEIMCELQSKGAHNINFVTPTHYAPSVRSSVELAREMGLHIPIVYNTGSYDSVDTLKFLEGCVDIYLADYKYNRSESAKKYSNAPDYVTASRAAIEEMVRQHPSATVDGGIMKSGVIVRVLLLPGHVAEAKLSVKYLYETYGNSIYISLMNQYTPMKNMLAPLNRRVSGEEYRELVNYAIDKGIKNAFIQEGDTAKESFIPPFDNTGV